MEDSAESGDGQDSRAEMVDALSRHNELCALALREIGADPKKLEVATSAATVALDQGLSSEAAAKAKHSKSEWR
jgi:hypothetical protein